MKKKERKSQNQKVHNPYVQASMNIYAAPVSKKAEKSNAHLPDIKELNNILKK